MTEKSLDDRKQILHSEEICQCVYVYKLQSSFELRTIVYLVPTKCWNFTYVFAMYIQNMIFKSLYFYPVEPLYEALYKGPSLKQNLLHIKKLFML